ncbi:hypothetical protein ACIGD1_07595 [Streptomyces sp. NPDC085612]|uniref:hypothetical protein n=1 Tax=Streptomyces sp. NPDC085612 TaxID=3365732 RepID=UPI0037CF13B3
MPFRPSAVPRRRVPARVRRSPAPLALLALLAFTATVLGCLFHDARPAASASPSALSAHSAAHRPHDPSAHAPSGIPHPEDHCLLHVFPRALQEAPAQRTAALPPLLALALFAAVLPGRFPHRRTASPPTARSGRGTRTDLCCWRI